MTKSLSAMHKAMNEKLKIVNAQMKEAGFGDDDFICVIRERAYKGHYVKGEISISTWDDALVSRLKDNVRKAGLTIDCYVDSGKEFCFISTK